MKKLANIALVLAAVWTAPLTAQSGIRIKAGASFGRISNKGVLPGSLGTRTGAAGGIALGTRGGLLGFGIEGLYAQRGLSSDEAISDAETRLDYFELPVYLRVAAPVPGFAPFAYMGPQVSLEVRCAQADGGSCTADPDRPAVTYAGVVGAGMQFGGLSIEGRYQYGLSDLKLATITDEKSFRDRTFMILLGIGF